MTSGVFEKRLLTVRRLIVHGVYWLAVSAMLDYATSWVMMWLRGSASEGNSAMVLLFEHPGFVPFLVKLQQEYVWLGLVAVGMLCFLLINSMRLRRASLKTQKIAFIIGLEAGFVIWLFAALRLALGPASNIFNIFYHYGELAGLAASLIFFLITAVVMFRDLKIRNREVDRFFCSS